MKQQPSNEELVAYLDGELEPAEANKIEQAIAADPQLQRKVDSMSNAYDLLETLVPPRASQEFTQRTLQTLHVANSHAEAEGQGGGESAVDVTKLVGTSPPQVSTAMLSGWAAAIVVSSAVGFLITNQWLRPKPRDLAADLPLLERLPVIQDAQNVEFVEALMERRFHEQPGPIQGTPNQQGRGGNGGEFHPQPRQPNGNRPFGKGEPRPADEGNFRPKNRRPNEELDR